MARGFVRWPKGFLGAWEGKAHELRKRLKLATDDALDPFALILTFDSMYVVSAEEISTTDGERHAVLKSHKNRWWAAAYREGDGPWMILYNPWQSKTRLKASLMEELAHIHLGHKPSKVSTDAKTGLTTRTYGKSKEKEAYGVAAAALVPFSGLVLKLRDGLDKQELAQHFGISQQLLNYRLNTTKASEVAQR